MKVTYQWVTQGDDRVCPICSELGNAPPWESNGEELPQILEYGSLGTVYNLEDDYSLVHRHGRALGECRCYVDCNVEVLWEGNYVDYGQVKAEILELQKLTLAIAGADEGGGGGGKGGGSGRESISGGSALYGAYRLTTLPAMANRMMTGNISPYDVRRLSNWLPMGVLLGPSAPYVAMAALLTVEVKRIAQQVYEDMNRVDIQAGQVRLRITERERFKAWGT